MKNKNNYPWFLKLTSSLSVYYQYVRRLNAIAVENKVPHKKRIADINLLLIQFSEALIEAEQDFLDISQFPVLVNEHCTPKEQHHAMGINFTIFLN